MNNYEKKKVLVLDGDSRQILPILHGLAQIKCEISTISNSKLANGYTSRYVTNRIIKSGKTEDEKFDDILDTLKTNKYDVLIALSDELMNLATLHFDEIKEYVRFPFANRDVFLRAYDKQQTLNICMENEIPCPITKKEEEPVEAFLQRIGFPIVAKPRMACGSMGLKIIHNQQQLMSLLSRGEIQLDKYVIQEYIPQTGKQINVHLFMDANHEMKSGVATEKTRWYPIDGGASCLCRTIHNEKVLADCKRLLKAIQWISYCEIELIEDPRDGVFKILEVNGRASASIKIMDLAGVNVAEQMMQLAYGEPVKEYKNYPDDIRMRRLSADILWFLQSPDRFTRKPLWFSPYKTHEVSFSIADPKPFFTTGIKMLKEIGNYKKEMQKRVRS